MGKHKIIKSAAAVALTASVVATAAPGASAASYKTNAKDQLVHTSTGKLVKGWKVFGGKLYKNGKLAPAKKYKIIGTGAAQKLFYGPTLKKGYKTANSKTLLFKDGKLTDGWKQAGKNERLYKNGKLDKGYTVFTNVEGDKFLYQNGYLKKGQKTANRGGETLLFVDGKLAKGYVLHEASKTLFNNGKVAEGLVKYPETDGKFYNDGKLADGEINGAEYKDGVLVAKDIASVKAINDTTVEVTFKKDQKDVKASDFKIEGLEVKNAATKQGDDKVVILTTSKQEAGKEYTLVYKEADTKTFTAKSDVIPTAISTSTASVQGTVGKEVTLKAQVTVAEGQSKAGIPVTFNIDGANNSLNKDIVAEAYTDENGVATYSYTQYNTAADSVAIYATGKPADRALSTVYWGVKEQLTVVENDTKGSTLANGDSKQYKVTYVDVDGKPLANKKLSVAFAENLNITPDKKSDAEVKDSKTGSIATPYQLADGTDSKVAHVETDENGVAIFTVTGKNTKVTPIVFKDDVVKNGEGNQKLEAIELQSSVSNAVTFQGAQLNHQITLTADTESKYTATGLDNGRTYTLTVLDKDGKPYAGGLVNLAFNEKLDKDAKTVTSAQFVPAAGYTLANGKNDAATQIVLDKDGKAKFTVATALENVDTYATPVAWIDQNNGLNTQDGVLENGEPTILGDITYFQAPAITGSKLALTDADGNTVTKKTIKASETAKFEYIATNQSGNEFLVAKKVTYTVTNTGSAPVEYATTNSVNPADWTTIEVGGKATFVVTDLSSTNEVYVKSKDGSKATSVAVEATGYSLKSGDVDKFLGTQTNNVTISKVYTDQELAINAINAGKGAVAKVETYNTALGLSGADAIVNDDNFDVVKKAVVDAYEANNGDLTASQIKQAVEKAVAEYDAGVTLAAKNALDNSIKAAKLADKGEDAEDKQAGSPIEGSSATLQAAITVAQGVLDGSASTDTQLTTAKTTLDTAIQDYKDAKVADITSNLVAPTLSMTTPNATNKGSITGVTTSGSETFNVASATTEVLTVDAATGLAVTGVVAGTSKVTVQVLDADGHVIKTGTIDVTVAPAS